MFSPDDELENTYNEIEDFEVGHCANCQCELRNPGNGLCLACESMIRGYEADLLREIEESYPNYGPIS